MRRNRYLKQPALVVIIFFSISFGYSQGIQKLYNKSFENTDLGDHPEYCLPKYSGQIPKFEINDCWAGDGEIFNWFAMMTNWVSYYMFDGWECNLEYGWEEYGPYDWYVHSPDWIGGATPCEGWSDCEKGWDGDYSVGMAPYEVIWQDFVGTDNTRLLDINKSYEIRIKVQPEGFRTITGTGPIYSKSLDVLLGTQAFTYKRDLMGFYDPLHEPNICRVCGNEYREYLIAPTEDIRLLKSIPVADFGYPGTSYTNQYGNWYELHFKMRMSDYAFTNPLFPISEFVQFGLDIRDPNPAAYSEDGSMCDGPYIKIDWVELFETCPAEYEIFGAKIAGWQSSYVASDHITAGFIDKGPAIVTPTGKTEFIAGHYVELVPGFFADAGSVLNIDAIPNVDCSLYKSSPIPDQMIQSKETADNRNNQIMISGENGEVKLSVYPNPASDFCMIELNKNLISNLVVIDNLGKTVITIADLNSNKYQLDVSHLPNGTYFVTVTTSDNSTYREKLIRL